MYRILLAAAVAATAAFASGTVQAGTADGVPLTPVAYYNSGDVSVHYDNGMHYGWRRHHRWQSMDDRRFYRGRPYYGSFHRGNRCRLSVVTRERAGRMVTVRREVCF